MGGGHPFICLRVYLANAQVKLRGLKQFGRAAVSFSLWLAGSLNL